MFTADSKISFKHSELLSFSGRADVMCIVCDNSAKHNSNTITLHLFPIGAGKKVYFFSLHIHKNAKTAQTAQT